MCLVLYGSNGPDALVLVSSFLFTAIVLAALAEGRWSLLNVLAATACGIIFCSAKPTYAPLLVAGFAGVLNRSHWRNVTAANAAILTAALAVTAWWLGAQTAARVPVRTGVDFAEQTAFIINHPLAYVKTLLLTTWDQKRFFYTSGVGYIGWLLVQLPKPAYFLPLLALALSLGGPRAPAQGLSWVTIAWFIMLLGSSVVLVYTALYIYWNPVAAPRVAGLQGRYFLPLLPLGLVILYQVIPPLPARWRSPLLPLGALACLAILGVVTNFTVIRAYRVFESL
jgi:hypothetical protein